MFQKYIFVDFQISSIGKSQANRNHGETQKSAPKYMTWFSPSRQLGATHHSLTPPPAGWGGERKNNGKASRVGIRAVYWDSKGEGNNQQQY